ncbi:MAG: hypothetical protein IRZ03_18690 [Acidobacterium ailaaui]|nr:hypothetical protein [Pseudacidobacterium ailaaui]
MFITKRKIDSAYGGIYTTDGGSAVTIDNNGQVHISSAQTDKWNKKIDDGLNNLKKFQDQLNAPVNTMDELGNHFAKVVNPELEDLKQNWQEEKINTRNDILNQDNKKQEKDTDLKKFASNLAAWCNETKPKYDAIISFYQMHKNDKESDLQNPTPPELDYQCVACDTNLKKQNEKLRDDYVEKFFKPEKDLLRDAIQIEKNLMLLGIGEDFTGTEARVLIDNDMAKKISKNFSKKQNGACAYLEDDQLNKAIYFLAQRMYARAKKLFHDYSQNIKTAPAVIKTLLTATREMILMGMKADDDGNMAECSALVSLVLENYSNKLFVEHDWSQLANIPFLIELERERQLMGASESNLISNLQQLLNGFRIQIEMNVKLGKNGSYTLTHLKGEGKIAPEFNYNNDTCYRWVVVEGTDPMGFPKKKVSQRIECDLLTNEIVVPGPRPVYIGTRKYYTILRELKMDYCHPGLDSIFLSGFIAEPDPSAGKWQVPMGPTAAWQINSTDNVFRDIKNMEELAKSGKARQGADKMKMEAEKLKTQMKNIEQQLNDPQNQLNVAKMKKLFDEMNDLSTKQKNLAITYGVGSSLYIDFPLQIKNNTTTLHNIRYDAKEINPSEAAAIVYAYYTIKIIYKQ